MITIDLNQKSRCEKQVSVPALACIFVNNAFRLGNTISNLSHLFLSAGKKCRLEAKVCMSDRFNLTIRKESRGVHFNFCEAF